MSCRPLIIGHQSIGLTQKFITLRISKAPRPPTKKGIGLLVYPCTLPILVWAFVSWGFFRNCHKKRSSVSTAWFFLHLFNTLACVADGMAVGATLQTFTRSCNILLENSDFDPEKKECKYTVEDDAIFNLLQFRLDPYITTLTTLDVKPGKHRSQIVSETWRYSYSYSSESRIRCALQTVNIPYNIVFPFVSTLLLFWQITLTQVLLNASIQ